MKKKRLAIAGCTGHVVKFGELVNSYEESEIVAVWDYDQKRGKEVADELNCPFIDDYDALINDFDLDGVLVIAENSFKADLIIRAAEHKIAVFVEKPLCVKLEEAYAIKEAVQKNNITFFMTDPFVRSGVLEIEKLISDGKLGRLTEANIRICQNRYRNPDKMARFTYEMTQGGIMADVGGHAIHIAHYLFGKPKKINSVLFYTTDFARENHVEDKAIITMIYPDDFSVVLECSFVSTGLENNTIIRGSEATAEIKRLSRSEGDEIVNLYRENGALETITRLPENPTRHIRYFVEMLVNGYPNDIVGKDPLSNSGVSIDNAVEYVEIINSIYQSANKGVVEVI